MKKRSLLILAVIGLSSLGLVGCNNGEQSKDGKIAIKYLISNESTAYKTILDDVISEFNASIEDEGYYIDASVPGGSYYESLGRLMAANNTPDIFMMEYGYFYSYQNKMADLTKYLDESEGLSSSDLWDLNDYYKDNNGKLKAIIKDFSPDFMLIYNKTMLDSYNKSVSEEDRFYLSETEPVTWEYFYKMVSALQRKGYAEYGTSLGFEGTKHLHEIVQSTGVNMYTNDEKGINATNNNLREAFAFFYALQKDDITQGDTDSASELQVYNEVQKLNTGKKAPASYTSGSTTTEQELFKSGRCFSIFNGLYSFPSYDFYNVNFEYGIVPHPVQNEGDKPFGTTSAMVSHAISASSRHKDIAWRFIEYYQTEGLKKLSKIAFNIPGNKTIAGSDAFLVQENEKVQKMVNYFYDFVSKGYCVPTEYNSLVDYSVINTCFSTVQSKYFSQSNPYTFYEMIDQVNLLIKQQTI